MYGWAGVNFQPPALPRPAPCRLRGASAAEWIMGYRTNTLQGAVRTEDRGDTSCSESGRPGFGYYLFAAHYGSTDTPLPVLPRRLCYRQSLNRYHNLNPPRRTDGSLAIPINRPPLALAKHTPRPRDRGKRASGDERAYHDELSFDCIQRRSPPLMQPKSPKPPACLPSTRFQQRAAAVPPSAAIALPRFGVLPCPLVAGLARAPYSAQYCDAGGMPTAVKTIAAPLFAHPTDRFPTPTSTGRRNRIAVNKKDRLPPATTARSSRPSHGWLFLAQRVEHSTSLRPGLGWVGSPCLPPWQTWPLFFF
ncbi:hypothetical protein B0T14DRAFT_248014 [Immersiella caudata]|uniref:Uncharacterized protein n=1 Tax=Immersiella caudata TaxID=314043 RepID=A0AA39WJD0_9PEZI|nr:hypothetical protein B0T14DRAFT_248014 [Immersiella caudata]